MTKFIYLILFIFIITIACGDNNSDDANPLTDVSYYNCLIDYEHSVKDPETRWCEENTLLRKLSVFRGGKNTKGSPLFDLTKSSTYDTYDGIYKSYEDSSTSVNVVSVSTVNSTGYVTWRVSREHSTAAPNMVIYVTNQ